MSYREIHAFLTHNGGTKAASVFIALCIWFWVNVTSPRAIVCTIERQVGYFNQPRTVRVQSPRHVVRMTVRGRRIDLMGNLDTIRAFVDLSRAGNSVGVVALPVENFVPGRLEFISVTPETVDVEISREVSPTVVIPPAPFPSAAPAAMPPTSASSPGTAGVTTR